MSLRLLIVSTLDSSQPFGAFTRPFYLGMHLAQCFEVCQLGLDCSSVHYSQSVSVGSRSLTQYTQAIRQCIETFRPDVIYTQETLPSIAALIVNSSQKGKKIPLVFDFHTLSAFEYWTRLPIAKNKFNELVQFVKTYIAQGILVSSGNPIIVAGQSIAHLLPKWYFTKPDRAYCVGNGVAEDLLHLDRLTLPDPYQKLRPAKIVAVVAPRTFQFPSNDMSVEMAVEIARDLETVDPKIHFVVIGRDAQQIDRALPSNITFSGFLPQRESFLNYLHYADIGLLPFPDQAVAGGARNKALDLFACRKLVVTTPEGIRGLEEFKHQQHLVISEASTAKVAQSIRETCKNFDAYEPLIEAAYRLVQDEYSWKARAEAVTKILETCQ